MSDQHVDQLRQLAKEKPATAGMPRHLARLHRRVMANIRAERTQRQVMDDEGRRWGPAGGITQQNRRT